MESRITKIRSVKNPRVNIEIINGHFATSHSHVNYYIDMTSMKCRHLRAKETAAEMADAYVSVPVDAIICLDGTEIIGAFLARAIANAGINGINRDHSIAVITPEINASNQMLLRDNVQPMVTGKNVILLEDSITTGKTINRAIECV